MSITNLILLWIICLLVSFLKQTSLIFHNICSGEFIVLNFFMKHRISKLDEVFHSIWWTYFFPSIVFKSFMPAIESCRFASTGVVTIPLRSFSCTFTLLQNHHYHVQVQYVMKFVASLICIKQFCFGTSRSLWQKLARLIYSG